MLCFDHSLLMSAPSNPQSPPTFGFGVAAGPSVKATYMCPQSTAHSPQSAVGWCPTSFLGIGESFLARGLVFSPSFLFNLVGHTAKKIHPSPCQLAPL